MAMAASNRSREIDRMVNRRLKSSWGQCSSSSENAAVSGSFFELHRLVNDIDADDTTAVSWDTVLHQCRSHPNQVMALDGRGRTCLASVCAKNPPLIVVETMLSLWKCRWNDAIIRDKTGWTAMTLAIANHASMEVVRLLATTSCLLVTTCDHHGNTPLHLACHYKHVSSADKLVTILLQADPRLAGRENSAGKTPLHVAIENRASLDVVRMLAEASPEAVVNKTCGRTPLFYAISNIALQTCRILVKVNPQVTHIRDDIGRLPLRCALENKCRDSKLVELLCTSQEAVLDCDGIGRNSLHLALERNVNPCIVETLLECTPQVARAFDASAVQMCYTRFISALRQRDTSTRHVQQCWKVLSTVLRAYDYETLDYSMLHAALATNAPIQVIQRILTENPQDVTRQNVDGRYPLSIACELMTSVQEKDGIINLILNATDSISSVMEATMMDDILSLLAEHGGVSSSVIYRIICANPLALRQLDPRHNLYPFMIAALPKDERGDDDSSIVQVGAIYELLSAAPELVKAYS